MKNIMSTVGCLLEGAARIFDFAGALNEENLYEPRDAAAIHNDWKAVGTDFNSCKKRMSEEINGFKKKKSGRNNFR